MLTGGDEYANEIAHAIKRGYCIDCDHQSGPHTFRIWTLGAGHRTETHPGVGPIGEYGRCASCEPAYLHR